LRVSFNEPYHFAFEILTASFIVGARDLIALLAHRGDNLSHATRIDILLEVTLASAETLLAATPQHASSAVLSSHNALAFFTTHTQIILA
jgi:hypothetical protein